VTALDDIQGLLSTTAERHGPAVVGVWRGWRPGSGLIAAPGRIVTAAHLVGPEGATVVSADGVKREATLAGVDRDLGVAVLETDTGRAEPPAWAPQEHRPAIGDPVVALSNPGGRGLRATIGFVSAAARSFRGPRGRRIPAGVEHTAALPRGSAGGPLLDAQGRLIGINLLRLEGGLIVSVGAASGLADITQRLARGEQVARPRLGVAVAPPWVARRMLRAVGLPERDGLLIRAVEADSPAARSGLERGDLIVAAGGRPVDAVDALHRALDESAANGGVALTVVRGTEEREVRVEVEGSES
jgi:serine protease Do